MAPAIPNRDVRRILAREAGKKLHSPWPVPYGAVFPVSGKSLTALAKPDTPFSAGVQAHHG